MGDQQQVRTQSRKALLHDSRVAGGNIEGTQELQETTTMDVPGSEAGYFVDNEEWTSFGESKWIEAGQQGGGYKDCCTLWWFYAGSYGPIPATLKPGPRSRQKKSRRLWPTKPSTANT
jgi:hypothetical protein